MRGYYRQCRDTKDYKGLLQTTDGDGQGGVACCDSWGRKESDTTERLNWTELNWYGNKMDNLQEMNRCLEKFNLPRLNQEEIEIMNNPIIINEIEAVIKNLPKEQKPRTRWLHRIILSNIYRRANAYPSKTLSKNCRGRKTSKLILRGHHHPDTKTRQRQHTKKKTTGQYHWWM